MQWRGPSYNRTLALPRTDMKAMRHKGTSLGTVHLENFWHRIVRQETARSSSNDEGLYWDKDNTLVSGLGLGLQETLLYLHSTRPTLEEFEQWILEQNGGSLQEPLAQRLNEAIAGRLPRDEADRSADGVEPVLGRDELEFWEQNGYVVLHDAVSTQNCAAAAAAIYEFLGAAPDNEYGWYANPAGHTIWVPLLRHPALIANRRAPRIHPAFAQLWGRTDLWANTDQCGFNPPERGTWRLSRTPFALGRVARPAPALRHTSASLSNRHRC